MTARATALILFAGAVVGCARPSPAPEADAERADEKPPAAPSTVKTVAATQEWRGEVSDIQFAAVAPKSLVITNASDFEKVWHAWTPLNPPKIDFTTSFVAVVTWAPSSNLLPGLGSKPPKGTDGVSITALKVLPDGGAMLAPRPHVSDDEKWTATKGFYWGIAAFPRDGIGSVNGTPLPPP